MNIAQVNNTRHAFARTIMYTGLRTPLESEPFKKRKEAIKTVLSYHDAILDQFWPSAVKRCLKAEGVLVTETQLIRDIINR